jgi:hypothetical protein
VVTPLAGFIGPFYQGHALHYMDDGKLHCLLCPNEKTLVWYVDSQEKARFPRANSKIHPSGPAISSDGTRLAVMNRLPDQKCVLQIDGKTWDPVDEIGPVLFSPDSKRCIAIVQRDQKFCLDIENQLGQAWDKIVLNTLTLSPDGKHIAFWAETAGKPVLVIDDHAATGPVSPSPMPDRHPVFHDDGTCSAVLASDNQVDVLTVLVGSKAP